LIADATFWLHTWHRFDFEIRKQLGLKGAESEAQQ